MISRVVDASVIVTSLWEGLPKLEGALLMAPALLDVEVTSAFRRLARTKTVDPAAVPRALGRLSHFPGLIRHEHRPLLPRIWELRDNLSAYDASYVALAERLGLPLVTLDSRLARAAVRFCAVESPR